MKFEWCNAMIQNWVKHYNPAITDDEKAEQQNRKLNENHALQ